MENKFQFEQNCDLLPILSGQVGLDCHLILENLWGLGILAAQVHLMTRGFLSPHLAHLFQEAPSFRVIHFFQAFPIHLLHIDTYFSFKIIQS